MNGERMIRFIKQYAFAFGACSYGFTFGIFSARNRALLSAICNHLGYNAERVRPIVPEVAMSEVVPDDCPIEVREPIHADGNVTLLELMVIAKLVRRHSPAQLFEIGTFDGRTTLNLAANSPPEATVYTLDLPREQMDATRWKLDADDRTYADKEKSGARFLRTDCQAKIVQLHGDSATFDFSPFHNRTDFVFIDGSHSFEYVTGDSENALKLLRSGRGVIVWHDYAGWPGVTNALNELYSRRPEFKGIQHIRETSLACLISG